MTCDCGQESNKVSYTYVDGKLISWCKYCMSFTPTPIFQVGMMDYTASEKGIKLGHLDNIRRRKLDETTGEVYIDRGRTSVTLNRTWKENK